MDQDEESSEIADLDLRLVYRYGLAEMLLDCR